MAVYSLTRFEVRPDALESIERAMHDYANYVRTELADSTWTVYRDPAVPTRFVCMVRATTPIADDKHRKAPGTQAFLAALTPVLVSSIEDAHMQLVTSSDLAPRPSRLKDRRPRRR